MTGVWKDESDGEVIEFKLPHSGVAFAFVAARKLCLLTSADFAKLRSTQGASPLDDCPRSEIRVIGCQKEVSEASAILSRAGALLGKPVILESPSTAIQFIPREGRIRVEITTSERRRHRILIVDDSETIRKLLSSIVSNDPELECVGTVERPSLVEDAIQRLRPDVITLDIHMPEMTGNELLKIILPKYKIPTIMISSLSKEDGNYVLDALEAGAVDYIQKPSMKELGEVAPMICEKIKAAAFSRHTSLKPQTPVPASSFSGEVDLSYLIAIGSSTGGTEALKVVLSSLPDKIPPIVIVQHIPPVFSKAFADRMNRICRFEVKEAEHGDRIEPSRVLIAPGGKQMRLKSTGSGLIASIEDTPPVNRHKPSVDALFDSVSELHRKKVAAAILTGMGADGAKGLLNLRQNGAKTLAQDEATCVVYGMPREAARLGAAEKIVPLQEVGKTLLQYCRKKSSDTSAA